MPPNRAAETLQATERLVHLTLALEEALGREAWEEADDLFAARDELLSDIPAYAVPREIDDIDARILLRLQRGQADVRRETQALTTGRRAAIAYSGSSAGTPRPYRSL